MLQCEIRSSTFHNIFSSIQIVFGRVSIQGSGCTARAVLTEDTARWSGSSPLVVSMWVPSFNIAASPLTTQIGFGVHSTPATATSLTNKLGILLTLFNASLMDTDSVHVTSERPNRPTELSDFQKSMPHSPTATLQPVSVALANGKITSLAVRWENADVSLFGSTVQAVQVSPCAMRVTLNKVSNDLIYPFPIDGQRSKLRIARKSGWIEVGLFLVSPVRTLFNVPQVVVPLSAPHGSGGFATSNFPILLSQDRPPTAWNMHRLNLERLPTLHLEKTGNPGWICPHVSMAMSDRERDIREQAESSRKSLPQDVLVQIKDTLHSLFMRASEPNARRIFGFTAPSCGTYTIVFLNQIRLDLASNTLVADSCVLPLTQQRVKDLGQYLADLASDEKMVLINTSDAEGHAWKQLFPAFVERCRTWSHKLTCQYIQVGAIPLSTELNQNPIW